MNQSSTSAEYQKLGDLDLFKQNGHIIQSKSNTDSKHNNEFFFNLSENRSN